MPSIRETSNDSNAKNTEYYEDLRTTLDNDINKIVRDYQSGQNAQYSYYLSLAKDALKKQGFKAREGIQVEQELIRFCLFLEDQEILESLPEWLAGSLDRNPALFKKYFRPFNYSDEEKARSEVITPEFKSREYKPLRLIEGTNQTNDKSSGDIDPELFDTVLEQHVDRLKTLRTQQIEDAIQQISKRLLNSDISNTSDVVAAIAENKALRQMLSICLNKVKVSLATTLVTDTEVQSKRTGFNPGETFTLEQYKNGVNQAVDIIGKLQEASAENEKSSVKIKTVESEKAQATRDAAKLRSELEASRKELERETSKPAIKDAKVLLYRIAWIDQGKRYYLGTSAGEDELIASSKTYPVRTLIKTTVKKESMVFNSIEDLKNQLDKAMKFYSKINRKQLISLTHLRECFVVTLLEYEDKSIVKKTIVKNIL